jgi:hypothetical protein
MDLPDIIGSLSKEDMSYKKSFVEKKPFDVKEKSKHFKSKSKKN